MSVNKEVTEEEGDGDGGEAGWGRKMVTTMSCWARGCGGWVWEPEPDIVDDDNDESVGARGCDWMATVVRACVLRRRR